MFIRDAFIIDMRARHRIWQTKLLITSFVEWDMSNLIQITMQLSTGTWQIITILRKLKAYDDSIIKNQFIWYFHVSMFPVIKISVDYNLSKWNVPILWLSLTEYKEEWLEESFLDLKIKDFVWLGWKCWWQKTVFWRNIMRSSRWDNWSLVCRCLQIICILQKFVRIIEIFSRSVHSSRVWWSISSLAQWWPWSGRVWVSWPLRGACWEPPTLPLLPPAPSEQTSLSSQVATSSTAATVLTMVSERWSSGSRITNSSTGLQLSRPGSMMRLEYLIPSYNLASHFNNQKQFLCW